MALVVTGQLSDLAESIVPALPGGASDAQKAARQAAVDQTKILVEKIMTYIVDQLEIKGVEADADTPINGVLSAGVPVPMDGGAALQITWKAATITPNTHKAVQSNDGKGLVL